MNQRRIWMLKIPTVFGGLFEQANEAGTIVAVTHAHESLSASRASYRLVR